MLFVIVGVILVGLNLAGIGPVAQWNWEFTGDLWRFVTPFLLALAWWAWADASGMTRRREMERDAERKAERRRRNISAMGLGPDAARGGRRR
jgi:small Trp-rich protein